MSYGAALMTKLELSRAVSDRTKWNQLTEKCQTVSDVSEGLMMISTEIQM